MKIILQCWTKKSGHPIFLINLSIGLSVVNRCTAYSLNKHRYEKWRKLFFISLEDQGLIRCILTKAYSNAYRYYRKLYRNAYIPMGTKA